MLLPDVPHPSPAQLDRVAETLAARADLWDALAARLAPDEAARVAGARGWEAWLRAGNDPGGEDVVRLEVRGRRARTGDRAPRVVACWRRTDAGLSRLPGREAS